MSMRLREGTIVSIDGTTATVRTSGKRTTDVDIRRLRLDGQESQIGEFVGAMRDSIR